MTTIRAEVVADSLSPDNVRLTTMQLTYPRFIHAEFMTHRVFSRNASSSRAIPTARLLRSINGDPAEPTFWGLNQPGMQARREAEGWKLFLLKQVYRSARRTAVRRAKLACWLGGHKQNVNRLVETHGHITVVVTSTSWENFIDLRDHPDAMPEIKILAKAIKHNLATMEPKTVGVGEWHLPYVETTPVIRDMSIGDRLAMSVARCARVSYLNTVGDVPTFDEDKTLYHRLKDSTPMHASPFEHQATPDIKVRGKWKYKHTGSWGNFYGWQQHRKFIFGEQALDANHEYDRMHRNIQYFNDIV